MPSYLVRRRLNQTKDQQLENRNMKLPLNGVNRVARSSRSAFTLIEMIGVLAVIAILASMLIPRVFEAINSARVNATAVACETIKTAAADHYGKYGQFDQVFGTNPVTFVGNLDVGYDVNVLMLEQLLDKPFFAKIAGGDPSTNAVVQLVKGSGAGNVGNNGNGYSLDGSGTITTGTNATFVLEAVMYGVSQADAKDLNDRIDGTALGVPAGADAKGRVEYGATFPTTVYVDLTHR
jgi:prepilin-type N-terminal cleavage/methylation domain-containing protein